MNKYVLNQLEEQFNFTKNEWKNFSEFHLIQIYTNRKNHLPGANYYYAVIFKEFMS